MAINYSAGFLPQALYSNMMQTQRDGLAEANQRERDRWSQLGQLGAAFVKGNINMGDKAQEAYTKNYDIQRKRLTDTMEKLDPRSGDYENYKNAIANLDAEYTTKMQDFQESGFLGNLGRDRDMLSELTNYEPGSYSPDSTAAAYALTDDQTKYQNKRAIDLDVNPKIAAETDLAKLNATAQWTASPEGQQYYETIRGRELEQKKEDAKIEVEKALEIQGGSNLDLIKARGEIDQMNGSQLRQLDLQLAQFQLDAAKQRHQMGMTRDEKQFQNQQTRDQATFEQNMELAKARRKGIDPTDPRAYANAEAQLIKTFDALNPQFGEPGLAEGPEDKQKRLAERAQALQGFLNERLGSYQNSPAETGNPSPAMSDPAGAAPASTPRMPEQPTTAPVAAPSAADLGFTPPPGQGFVSQDFLNNLDVQTTDLGNRVERLQNDSGKPMFPDLQKRADQLMVRAEQAYKEMAAAKTPEQQKAIRQKLSAVSKEIFQLSNELDKKEMESGSFRGMMRKAGQALGW